MKKSLLGLGLIAALLLASCSQVFDGLIGVVYKDKLNQYDSTSIKVTLSIDTTHDFPQAKQSDSIMLALVPVFDVSGGALMPKWDNRIESQYSWSSVVASNKLEATLSAPKGFKYWLFVWQGVNGAIDDPSQMNRPSKRLSFFFNKASGSNQTLDGSNSNSGPYVNDSFLNSQYIDKGLWDSLFSTNTNNQMGENFSVNGDTTIDLVDNGGTTPDATAHMYAITRYGSNPKPVSEILYKRTVNVNGLIYPVTRPPEPFAEPDWSYFSIDPSTATTSYISVPVYFNNLECSNPAISVYSQPITLEFKILYTDGTKSTAQQIQSLQVSFKNTGGGLLPAGTPMSLTLMVDRSDDPSDYGNRFVEVDLYDEYGSFINSWFDTTTNTGVRSFDLGNNYTSDWDGGYYSAEVWVASSDNSVWQYSTTVELIAYSNICTTTADWNNYWYDW